MTILTQSWMWVSSTLWPGFSNTDQDNLDSIGDNLSISPSSYTAVALSDGDNDFYVSDSDTDDKSTATADQVIIGGVAKTVKEIANYTGGTLVVDGHTYTNLPMVVTLFTDGTYGVRLADTSIPLGEHYKNVTQVTLGNTSRPDYHLEIASIDAPFVCFAAGTLIDTVAGPRPVQSLMPGDMVPTLDHGPQPVRWRGVRTISGRGRFAPINFASGALGNASALRLSPQHRVLIGGWRAELLFGTPEVLVPALHLVNDHSIRQVRCKSVTYVHVLFDRHEIIGAQGLLSESFHPAAYGMSMLDAPTRDEILALFPELGDGFKDYGRTARACLKRWESRLLLTA